MQETHLVLWLRATGTASGRCGNSHLSSKRTIPTLAPEFPRHLIVGCTPATARPNPLRPRFPQASVTMERLGGDQPSARALPDGKQLANTQLSASRAEGASRIVQCVDADRPGEGHRWLLSGARLRC